MRIVILEDNAERRAAMSSNLSDLLPNISIEFFVASQPLIDHLSETGIYDVAMISLDNDLEMFEGENGSLVDPGDGVAVAKWLCTQPPICPVVIHTTNSVAGNQMEELLGSHGWDYERIVPYDGETWITARWRAVARDLLVTYAPGTSVSFTGVKVLKHGLEHNFRIEQILEELLRLSMQMTCGVSTSKDVCFEIAYLARQDELTSIVAIGFSLLAEIGVGAAREVIEWSAECFGKGPVSSAHVAIEPMFRQLLQDARVRDIQFDVLQPKAGHQAVFLTATKDPQLDLCGHRFQANLRQVRALAELALLTRLNVSQDHLDGKQQSKVVFDDFMDEDST